MPQTPPQDAEPQRASSAASVALGLLLPALVGGAGALPRLSGDAHLWGACLGAALLMLLGFGALWLRDGGAPPLELRVRRHHWVQVIVQGAIFIWWAMHVPMVAAWLPLVGVQILFAIGLNYLWTWLRFRSPTFSFAPAPVVVSTNLFLWFVDALFAVQLLMIAVALLSKELITWTRDGQRTHIFNPSAIALSLASIALIVANRDDLSLGVAIATTLGAAPHMWELIFGAGVVVQLLFGTAPVTLSAAIATAGGAFLYQAYAGEPFFVDTVIPIAVFLGMHLLITDPVTSPRSASGKVIFGLLYGLAVLPLYVLLTATGRPAFYDKLIQVPLLNLLVPAIDKLGRGIDEAVPNLVVASRRAVIPVALWCAAFLVIRPALTQGSHEVAAWQDQCLEQGDAAACEQYVLGLRSACYRAIPEACHDLGVYYGNHTSLEFDKARALDYLGQACALGRELACRDAQIVRDGGRKLQQQMQAQALKDCAAGNMQACVALGTQAPAEVMHNPAAGVRSPVIGACEDGDATACERVGLEILTGTGAPPNPKRAAPYLTKACDGDRPVACANLGLMTLRGDGVAADVRRGIELHQQACDLGLPMACGRLGVLLAEGKLVPPDPSRARALFELACAGGDPGACRRLK